MLALWVASLREPVRGAMVGTPSPSSPAPFREFGKDLSMIVPPLRLYGAWQRGPAALAITLGFAAAIAAFARWLIELSRNFPQWSAVDRKSTRMNSSH